ncbi:cyclic-phosphate processing receiver domain-containing protein [Vibrio vulnificus]|uniref:cyclic-phosphate processing receiver domain-containing protein n=1 Tax=Vibrio vulnificus TaxID=672 RepID=UPI0038B2A788
MALLKQGTVTEISLDHDLGDDEHSTGYDVVLWIEEAVATQGFQPPKSRFTVLTHLQGRKWSSVS